MLYFTKTDFAQSYATLYVCVLATITVGVDRMEKYNLYSSYLDSRALVK